MNNWIWANLDVALSAISQNKLRSLLTALGIIFGVSAVITMLSIGNGAKQEILKQLEIIGTNNIVIEAIKPSLDGDDGADDSAGTQNKRSEKKAYSPGLTINDVHSITALLPDIKSLSYEVEKKVNFIRDKNSASGICRGVNADFFDINNLGVALGSNFSPHHYKNGLNACIIGSDLAKKMFLGKDPRGEFIKADGVGLRVIGVLEKRLISKENQEKLSVSPYGNDIFVPVETFFLRYEDRAYISKEDISRRENDKKISNYHQLDKITVKVSNLSIIEPSAAFIERLLKRKHNDRTDYTVTVPELLIKQQQSTQETMNLVLAVIAGISLLVGGIGIMNIMLSSVLERIKEIGVRRSLGAKKRDIILQFLLEAVLISLVGGAIGVILGIAGAQLIGIYADIKAVVSPESVFLSFIISFLVGLFFGIMPAQKAANLDPITAIRN